MKRTPVELAALASAAVPALALTGVAGSPDDAADFDSALLVDDSGKQWRVRSPKHIEASMRLETELLVLRAFVPAVRAELPFALPYVAGTVRQGELCTFVYSHLPGATRDIDELGAAGAELAAEIGRTMAAIHALPQSLVNNADLPSYTANEFRQRKLNELDQAATTGKIPAPLLRRWEHALEDVSLWRFSPTVVHGDLHEDNLLVSGGRISAVTGWTDLRIGDPADDFAWLIAANNSDFADAVHSAYVAARPDVVDPHLTRRAALSAEFALAQWLVRGLAAQNQDMVDEAVEMLATLEADILQQEAAIASQAGADQAGDAAATAGNTVPAEDTVPAGKSVPTGKTVPTANAGRPGPSAQETAVQPGPSAQTGNSAPAGTPQAGTAQAAPAPATKPDPASGKPALAAAGPSPAGPAAGEKVTVMPVPVHEAGPDTDLAAAVDSPPPAQTPPGGRPEPGSQENGRPQGDSAEPATNAIELVAVKAPAKDQPSGS